MKTTPYWEDTARLPKYPQLDRNLHVDTAIIGAGITGISVAYELQRAGHSIALVERERCAQMDTGHTSAHLTYVTDTRLSKLVSNFGSNHAQAVWDAGQAAIARIAGTVRELGLDCEFRWVPGYLHASLVNGESRKEISQLKREAQLAADMGFDTAFARKIPLLKLPGIRFSNQAKFHPRKYLAGVLQAITGKHGLIFERTSVDEIKEKPLRVVTKNATIQCDNVVIATNVPLQGITNTASAMLFQSKLVPYTSYVLGAQIPRGWADEASYWDTTEPYYYLRIDHAKAYDYAIFGGEDHKTGQASDTNKCYRRLEATFRKIFMEGEIDSRWSGQVIETNDGLPFIGETAPHQFVATGFCGNGMTFATVAAMMIRDAIAEQANPWRELFSPDRKILNGGTWDYLKENKDYPYYLLKDRLAKAEGKSVRGVKKGQGKILKIKGQKVAAFRDDHGKITLRSAVCTHMGCLVDWNEAERTWDCPCHGSRFKATGEVQAGPAETDLAPVD